MVRQLYMVSLIRRLVNQMSHKMTIKPCNKRRNERNYNHISSMKRLEEKTTADLAIGINIMVNYQYFRETHSTSISAFCHYILLYRY